MLSEVDKEFRKYFKHCHSLNRIIEDTQYSFEDIHSSLETVCGLIYLGIEFFLYTLDF